MSDLLARAWHALRPAQGAIAWLISAKFAVGVTGIVRAPDGRVLLLRHRLWPPEGQWGFPSGFARHGETFQQTIVREVREETGLTVTVGRLLEVQSGQRLKAQVYYEARLAGGLDGLVLDRREILDARLFALDSLPAAMTPMHRELALRGGG
jgi:ADP-ribose pyrophosphatase YjhB (NUDIX family)